MAETLKQSHDNFKYIERQQLNVSAYDKSQKPFTDTDWELTPFETILSQIPKAKVAANFKEQLISSNHYSAYGLNVAQKSPIRLPQAMRPVNLPGNNGEDLVSYLYYLREAESHRFEMVEDSLAVAFPSFKKLSFPPPLLLERLL